MKFSFALAASALLGASFAYAQSSSSSSAASSLIPSGISQSCSDFMSKLNSDASIGNCTKPLLSATSYYANASSEKGAVSSDSTNQLQTSLGQLCGADAGCDLGLIRRYLSQFWTNCNAEIKASNKDVQDIYDVLYLINPFRAAVCTKDGDGNYCVMNIAKQAASNTTSITSKRSFNADGVSSPQHRRAHHHLAERQSSNLTDTSSSVDNSDIANTNFAFLFLQPTAPKSILCSECSKNILAAYIQFETTTPYAVGLVNSDVLRGQSSLYKAAKSTCGNDFTTQINAVAGTTAFAEVGGAAALVPQAAVGFAALALAVVAAL